MLPSAAPPNVRTDTTIAGRNHAVTDTIKLPVICESGRPSSACPGEGETGTPGRTVVRRQRHAPTPQLRVRNVEQAGGSKKIDRKKIIPAAWRAMLRGFFVSQKETDTSRRYFNTIALNG
jgi:hypothetical protein